MLKKLIEYRPWKVGRMYYIIKLEYIVDFISIKLI